MARPFKDLVVTLDGPATNSVDVNGYPDSTTSLDTYILTIPVMDVAYSQINITSSTGLVFWTVTTKRVSADQGLVYGYTIEIDNRDMPDLSAGGTLTVELSLSDDPTIESTGLSGNLEAWAYCSNLTVGNAYVGRISCTLCYGREFLIGSRSGHIVSTPMSMGLYSTEHGNVSSLSVSPYPEYISSQNTIAGDEISLMGGYYVGNFDYDASPRVYELTGPVEYTIAGAFVIAYTVQLGAHIVAGGAGYVTLAENCRVDITGYSFVTNDGLVLGMSDGQPVENPASTLPRYHFDAGSPCTITVTPDTGTSICVFRAGLFGGSSPLYNWDNSNGTVTFTPTGEVTDIRVAVLCLYDVTQVVLKYPQIIFEDDDESHQGCGFSATRTRGGTTVSASWPLEIANGDSLTLTATASALYKAGMSDEMVSLYSGSDYGGPSPAGTVWTKLPNGGTGRSSNNPVTFTVAGVSPGGDGWRYLPAFPSFWPYYQWAEPQTRFPGKKQDSQPWALDFFLFFRRARFTVRFDWKTYGAHGAVSVGTGSTAQEAATRAVEVNSGDKVKASARSYFIFDAASGFFVYGIVMPLSLLTRYKIYSYPDTGGRQPETFAVGPESTTEGSVYRFDVWIWPLTTGKILYSQTDDEILCGPDGSPMAQFVDVQQQGA